MGSFPALNDVAAEPPLPLGWAGANWGSALTLQPQNLLPKELLSAAPERGPGHGAQGREILVLPRGWGLRGRGARAFPGGRFS